MSGERSTREGILLRLLEEFRGGGFDGVSLSRISDVTGLGKASLYHHFPGGKTEMAEAVMGLAAAWLETNVFSHLEAEGDPSARLGAVLKSLDGLYEGGAKSCLLDVMPIGGSAAVRATVKTVFLRLTSGFERLARDAGLPNEVAKVRAEAALVSLQGSLVVARGLSDPSPFRRAVEALRQDFLQRP